MLSPGLGVAVVLNRQKGREHLESYTVTALRGTIFLDCSESVLRNGETIIHESAHNWLNAAFAALTEPLPPTPTWWSPWRGTDRPLAGILHGIFAFGCVVEFLRRAIASGVGSAEDRDYARRQIENQRKRIALLATELPVMLHHLRSKQLRLLFSALFQESLAALP
jgi:HEXXH motif-containing protein